MNKPLRYLGQQPISYPGWTLHFTDKEPPQILRCHFSTNHLSVSIRQRQQNQKAIIRKKRKDPETLNHTPSILHPCLQNASDVLLAVQTELSQCLYRNHSACNSGPDTPYSQSNLHIGHSKVCSQVHKTHGD